MTKNLKPKTLQQLYKKKFNEGDLLIYKNITDSAINLTFSKITM